MKTRMQMITALSILALVTVGGQGCFKEKDKTEQSQNLLGPTPEDPQDPNQDTPEDPSPAALNMFEEELVGAWSRYHSYDGSTEYYVFNADRTGCKWEETSTGSITDESSYTHWELRQKSGPTVHLLWVKGTGAVWNTKTEYHFDQDTVWKGGYSNLKMYRDSGVSGCFQ